MWLSHLDASVMCRRFGNRLKSNGNAVGWSRRLKLLWIKRMHHVSTLKGYPETYPLKQSNSNSRSSKDLCWWKNVTTDITESSNVQKTIESDKSNCARSGKRLFHSEFRKEEEEEEPLIWRFEQSQSPEWYSSNDLEELVNSVIEPSITTLGVDTAEN